MQNRTSFLSSIVIAELLKFRDDCIVLSSIRVVTQIYSICSVWTGKTQNRSPTIQITSVHLLQIYITKTSTLSPFASETVYYYIHYNIWQTIPLRPPIGFNSSPIRFCILLTKAFCMSIIGGCIADHVKNVKAKVMKGCNSPRHYGTWCSCWWGTASASNIAASCCNRFRMSVRGTQESKSNMIGVRKKKHKYNYMRKSPRVTNIF